MTQRDYRKEGENWAWARHLRLNWDETDIARWTESGRAGAVFSFVHAHPERRLGNNVAFAELYLGRRLREDELLGGEVCLEQFGLFPGALSDLIVFLDGLWRIGDPRITAEEQDDWFGGYQKRSEIEDRFLGWFLDRPNRQGLPDAQVRGRRRDWEKRDYDAMPIDRYIAWGLALEGISWEQRNPQVEMSVLVFQRQPGPEDVVDYTIFIPREMNLQPDGFSDLCEFIGTRRRRGEIATPTDWATRFPDMMAYRRSIEQ